MTKPSPQTTLRKENQIWFGCKKNQKVTAKKVRSPLKFEALPNEVIYHVFSFLKMMDLLTCGQVSKRFRAISNDDQYLWPKRLNLWNKKVPAGLLQKVLDGGCKYLSLSEAVLEGSLYLPKDSANSYGFAEGGGLYALGLIHANHGGDITEYLLGQLKQGGNEPILTGGCLGLGLAAMGTHR